MSLETVVVETGPAPTWAVIWLHGLGADGHDFEAIVPELVQRGWPSIRFVFPHAPVMPVTINQGYAMRAWYDITGSRIEQKQDAVGIMRSVTAVGKLVEAQEAAGIPSHRVLLAGFSQGGAITLATGLRWPRKLGGLMALSTYLPLHSTMPSEASDANRAVPIFMAHGTLDPVVPMALGTMSRQHLEQHGWSIDWHQYGMPHSVCQEEIADMARWMGARFSE